MGAADSPRPAARTRGFSQLETLPEGFAETMRRDVAVGDVIGERYRILGPIAHGAMGKVFLAENQAIGLRVAVKLLKPELLASPEYRLRFKHEAEAVAAIQHPNVARFLDLVVGDPTFLVVEYVDGPTLHQVLSTEGQLAPRRAVDIAVRLAWGLHAAHKVGVVHRDLKPANILLSPDDETGEVPKIIDFGLAKTAAAPGAPLTRAGQIVGTPEYMAPEQIVSREVDARSDIYALGCVLYAMLCGRPPFVDAGDDVQLFYRQLHEPVQPVRRHAAHVSAELEAAVLRALEKEPERRFQSAQDFARALVPMVEKRESRRPASITAVVRRPRARTWWALGASALLLVGAVLGLRWHGGRGAMLIVVSDPAGADVDLDGRPTGDHTPTALRGLGPGEHTVRLRHPSFTDLSRLVSLGEGGRQLVDVHLLPRSHALELQTVPAGATVFVDGVLVAGKTPLSFELSDGEFHAIRVEKPGYHTVLRNLTPDQTGPLAPLVLAPDKQPRGTIYVVSNAPAEVWIDGQYSGFMTPTPGLRVAVGHHQVALRDAAGALLDQVRTRVGAGETAHLTLQTRPQKAP